MPTIEIPTPLRPYTDGKATVSVTGETVADSLQDLFKQYPTIQHHIQDKQGKLRSFVNIYVEDEDIRSLDNEQTTVEENTNLIIVPSIAGGR